MALLRKKQKRMLLGLALAGTSAYYVKTFWGGDTIIGALLSTAVGAGPIPGAIAGALVPNREGGRTLTVLSPEEAVRTNQPPATAPNGADTA